jgi:hypothetical protein
MSWDQIWQTVMVLVGTVNLLIALVLFFKSRKQAALEPHNAKYFLLLRIAGLIFISVALYRSIFVAKYSGGLVWFDTMLNSPFIVRCLAALAELSFVGLIAAIMLKMIKELALDKNNKPFVNIISKLPYFAVGFIFTAQIFVFYGLITKYMLPFAIEEVLWALAFFSFVPLVIMGLRSHSPARKDYKAFLIIMAVWCCGYLIFQCFYALPFMYFANVAQDAGKAIPQNAFNRAVFDYTMTRDFNTWGGIGFFVWHSGYFSVCSWMSLFFMSAPRKREV